MVDDPRRSLTEFLMAAAHAVAQKDVLERREELRAMREPGQPAGPTAASSPPSSSASTAGGTKKRKRAIGDKKAAAEDPAAEEAEAEDERILERIAAKMREQLLQTVENAAKFGLRLVPLQSEGDIKASPNKKKQKRSRKDDAAGKVAAAGSSTEELGRSGEALLLTEKECEEVVRLRRHFVLECYSVFTPAPVSQNDMIALQARQESRKTQLQASRQGVSGVVTQRRA
jgi:hypothetical protein